MGKKWFYGTWEKEVQGLEITTLELYPILVAVNIWGEDLSDLNLIIFTDNEALGSILNNQSKITAPV